ncbi:DUF1549 domain-containing protein [Novipirellula aureliae]|nr:DUF1549 domain-containing protein [Novipirellula aureliae]
MNNPIALTNRNATPDVEVRIAAVNSSAVDEVVESAAQVDALIEMGLKSHGVQPNPVASDEQFVRRVYLDISGTIPTAQETKTFLTSEDPNKRAQLIDDLLNKPGYASHLFNYWAGVLRLNDRGRNLLYLRPFGDWLKQSFQENTPFDKMVYEMLTAEGKSWENPAVGYKLRDRGMPLDNLSNTVQIFLGTRIGCAQCHDSPFDQWTQKEFYELAAFESGVETRSPRNAANVPDLKFARSLKDEVDAKDAQRLNQYLRANSHQVYEKERSSLKYPDDYAYSNAEPGEVAKLNVLFGDMPEILPGQSRRQAYAQWMTSKDNPRFTLTIANRMWKRAMGVGFVEPVDDVAEEGEHMNPELEQYLVSEMKRLDFNLKEFMRIIYNTQAYQRQVSYTGYEPGKPYLFEGPVLRRMTAEQVWDSLLTLSIKSPDSYLRPDDSQFIEAINLERDATKAEMMELIETVPEAMNAIRREERAPRYKNVTLRRAAELPQPLPDNHFLRQFGQSDREIISSGSSEGTVPQLLTLFNGPVTHMMLESGSVIRMEIEEADSAEERIDIIFLSILGRMPTLEQKRLALNEARQSALVGYGNVVWSLLNTREFLFVQ